MKLASIFLSASAKDIRGLLQIYCKSEWESFNKPQEAAPKYISTQPHEKYYSLILIILQWLCVWCHQPSLYTYLVAGQRHFRLVVPWYWQ